MQREINRLFDRFQVTGTRESGFSFVPAAEMQDTPEAFLLKLEVPGFKAEDLDIQVTGEAISIRGERRSESTSEDKGITRSEFRYGRFRRVIPLPARVQNDQVEATYDSGILNLRLPKAESEKTRVVKVNVAG
jgi:HSP20 family protein